MWFRNELFNLEFIRFKILDGGGIDDCFKPNKLVCQTERLFSNPSTNSESK